MILILILFSSLIKNQMYLDLLTKTRWHTKMLLPFTITFRIRFTKKLPPPLNNPFFIER